VLLAGKSLQWWAFLLLLLGFVIMSFWGVIGANTVIMPAGLKNIPKDLYEAADVDDTLGALSDLVHQGKIRYAGSSTYPAEYIVEAQWVAERRGRERFRCEQPPYSILVREVERSVLPTCQRYGMGVIPWSPLAGGYLAGRYRKGAELPPDSRMARRFRRQFEAERQRGVHEPRPDGRIVELANFGSRFEADVAIGVLESNGIQAHPKYGDAGGWLPHVALVDLFAVEGAAATMPDFARRWADPASRERMLSLLRAVETEPTLLGASPHLLAIARST